MRRIPLAFAAIAMLAGCDTVTSRYDDLAQARADHLFERGWLPDVLPPSSRDILVSNDLNLGISEGGFRFAPAEFALLQAKLNPFSNPAHPFNRAFDDRIERHISTGEPAYQYEGEGSNWIFLCKPARGECTYDMWDDRFVADQ